MSEDVTDADRRISHVCSLALGYGASGRADVMAEYQRERHALISWVEEMQDTLQRVASILPRYRMKGETAGKDEELNAVLESVLEAIAEHKQSDLTSTGEASVKVKDDMEAVWGGWV